LNLEYDFIKIGRLLVYQLAAIGTIGKLAAIGTIGKLAAIGTIGKLEENNIKQIIASVFFNI